MCQLPRRRRIRCNMSGICSSCQVVGFAASAGTVDLNNPQGFSADLSNFAANDAIDLLGSWDFSSFAENSSSTLGTPDTLERVGRCLSQIQRKLRGIRLQYSRVGRRHRHCAYVMRVVALVRCGGSNSLQTSRSQLIRTLAPISRRRSSRATQASGLDERVYDSGAAAAFIRAGE